MRCDCWKHASADRLARDADIPPRYEKCDLDNFHDYNDSLSKAVGRARRFVEEFPAVDRGLLLYGRPGLGKTHLAIACLKLAAHARGLRGVFYDTRELLRRIRQSYDPVSRTTESERDVVNAVVGADLLVLDDIGAERATEWVEEMLHLIVNARYNDRRPTIFTTNYPIEPPSEAKHAETLLERVGFPHVLAAPGNVRVRAPRRGGLSRGRPESLGRRARPAQPARKSDAPPLAQRRV